MAGTGDEKDGLASQPGSKRKIGRKHLNTPKPIVIPDSCKITPDGGLDSPWMRLGHDIGLNLTAPRTPEQEHDQRTPKPAVQLEESASTAESKQAPAKKKDLSSKQERVAPSPSTKFTPKKSRKSWATPLSRTRSNAPDGDISYWSNSRRSSDTRNQDRSRSSSDLEDEYRPEQVGYSSAEKAYQYGAGDDDAEGEYATIYDGDDQGAKMRRF
ncbi:hypothetical protein LA080_005983 [Diaporthe eres]|uniref:Uncharacterized protein n=1 Tax=Diaporthe vaccinii TaxID=105482 RepID=A0ABR4ERX2_9PEZI|nr:hypothetical protein LA080_005983 [Diaporthe eres]